MQRESARISASLCRGHPAGSGRGAAVRAVVAVLVVAHCAVMGCSDATKRKWKHQPAQTNYNNALYAEDADVRRDAVARIAESRYVDSDDAFKILDAVARTDAVSQIRCVAVRAFVRYGDARPVATLLTILAKEKASADALPPDDDVRWESARSLLALLEKGFPDEAQRAAALDVFIRMAEPDALRSHRLTALEALGRFKDPRVLKPLVAALRTPDFAVAERAEQSLIALTGTTHFYNADDWETWLAQAADPFANAGHVPDIPQPEGPTWWDKQKRAWRRALRLGERR